MIRSLLDPLALAVSKSVWVRHLTQAALSNPTDPAECTEADCCRTCLIGFRSAARYDMEEKMKIG